MSDLLSINSLMRLKELKPAIELMYNRLAEFLLDGIELTENMTILEGGCGRGQLTIPLINLIEKKIQKYQYFALDLSSGPYEKVINQLKEKLVTKKWKTKIKVLEGNITSIDAVKDEFFSLIISNELFCDLGRIGLKKALTEFYRVLKYSGQMCHSELIPFPSNYSQELFIKADSYCVETVTPEYEWFSPCADEVVALMYKAGFSEFDVRYFEPNVILAFNEALEELQGWHIDEAFIHNYENELKEHGIEYPLSHVIYCRKSKSK